jgi:predicted HTH domain antitoxin
MARTVKWTNVAADDLFDAAEFIAKDSKEDVSKTVRELVELGRLHLAMGKYRSSGASLEKSARIAGVSVSRMMDLLRDFGIEANLELEDYRASLNTARSLF